jgi:hypothetical protein
MVLVFKELGMPLNYPKLGVRGKMGNSFSFIIYRYFGIYNITSLIGF